MTNREKIIVALATLTLFTMFAGSAIDHFRVKRLEKNIEAAKTKASTAAARADEKEKDSEIYKAKTEYLEQQLTEIQTIARKQDDELEKININNRGARGAVDRARRTRSIATTANELCAKLAEVGHACEAK